MEIGAFILSILAILISVIVPFLEHRRDYNINKTNLESEYFKEIYQKPLIYDIPKARGFISWNNNTLIGTDKLIEELHSLKISSLYFQYANPSFFNKLKKAIDKLEDYLVENTDKVLVGESQTEILTEIKTQIESIYRIIMDAYIGKS